MLAEGILRVVETIPTEYEVLEFQCAQTQVVLHDWFRAWVAQFIRRCSQAVSDYAVLVEQHALTDTQKALLLP
ncbi:hypothetical protein H6F51_12810 [Cyanobacteria bacterium FACHB-DQ100]|nr:hypothetical protein [Cyanobacteria bacterium FACHB-DQ100]